MAIEILMPSLDPSMIKARVVKWLKQEADSVAIGDPLVEIETDKAVVEVEAENAGRFGKGLVEEGDYADVNSVIGLLFEPGESIEDQVEHNSGKVDLPSVAHDPQEPEVKKIDQPAPPAVTFSADPQRIFASPLARRLATLEGLELAAVSGSGPNGRIVKRDIEAALTARNEQLQPVGMAVIPAVETAVELQHLPSYEKIELTAMRQTIARRLTESSQQIPHYFLSIDCELDQLLSVRKQLNADLDDEAKISLNDFIIRTVALAMKKVPNANVMWNHDSILRFSQVDISVAVAIDGGLITPVIRQACGMGLVEIAAATKNLADKARKGKLVPEDYQGGTFTISNLGMYGIKNFTSIINPPQSAILSVGAGEQRPVVKDGELAVATVMTITLAADHRCLDGAAGSEFLATFKRLIEAPLTMLL
ncbi:pyruvate dehydrogenase complex dihydrolipoamide acetyltransferase [uncultured Desulfuromusa sp.]|uniref:pyruvate dehydrogenase complex dihydrolipoamide acetyltransferase n=1 Tax=uncultured Desulfuromusa sp. TaxID=219183 RepID=UPI002AA84A76|nr:pyruvate dehydrogenase complex dihydrolipoamide acetyltransferase [uncultured Desulfuromusa sp.]